MDVVELDEGSEFGAGDGGERVEVNVYDASDKPLAEWLADLPRQSDIW